ncbi:hypothetical protein BC941DRAFT_517315 [Chlamydoabsidia padenii]|nr:hypothetical protein BC941DRAFT_517315 [Chlamydoabsidia padenii]
MQLKTILATFPLVLILAGQANGQQVSQVVDANNFCVYLPPPDSVNRNIADTEWNAQAFCMGTTPQATKANKMPDGFIQSAHFVATDKYVQVTGQIDPIKAKLNATDDGGQMDIAAPKGSTCAGWKFYVNMIEPTGKTYCMRCCNDKVTCNRGISEKGCAHVIPGDYSGPMTGGGSSTQPSVSVSVSSSSKPSPSKSLSSTTSTPLSTPPATDVNSSNDQSGQMSAQSVDKSNAGSISQPAAIVTLLAVGFGLLAQ